MNIYEEMEEFYSLKHLIRYNNLPRITNESVAEHSYFVSLAVLRLSNIYNFNLEKALIISIIHDIPEIKIGDIPSNIKRKFKNLNDMMKKIENEIVSQNFPEYLLLFTELEEQETVESLIVKYADLLSVYQYSSIETKLGSNYYMPEVKKITEEFLKNIEKRLKKYEK